MKLYPISFHDWRGFAVRHDRDWWLSPRQISDHLGMNWRRQLRKIDRSETAKGVALLAIPSAGGFQETTVMRLGHFGAWLLSINPGMIAEDRREKLVAMQDELLAAISRQLEDLFGLPHCEPEELMDLPMPSWVRSSLERAEVLEARVEFLESAETLKATSLYRIGLPGTKTGLLLGKSAYWARKLRREMERLGLVAPRKPSEKPAPLPLFDREA